MNIKELQNIHRELSSERWYNGGSYDDAIQALYEYQAEYEDIGLVSLDTVEELAKSELEQYGLARLMHFLHGAQNGLMSDNDYYIDGYGNLQNITREWLLLQLEDAICNLRNELNEGKE